MFIEGFTFFLVGSRHDAGFAYNRRHCDSSQTSPELTEVVLVVAVINVVRGAGRSR